MRNSKTRLVFLILTMIALLMTSACGAAKDSGTPAESTKAIETAASTEAAPADPFGKFDPAVELSTIYPGMADAWVKLPEGDTPENNAWSRAYLDEFGIKLKVLWTCTSDKSDERVNLMLASGDLPDVFYVNRNQFIQLASAEKIEDLTEAFNKYISPEAKECYFPEINQLALNAMTVDGKLLGIPRNNDFTENTNVLWVRYDWLKALNLPDPKTIDDVTNTALAFMTQAIDGKKAQYGVAINKDTINNSFAINTMASNTAWCLWNAFHAYPGMWVKDETGGKLVAGDRVPAMKTAILKLREWYEKGIIPKDFGVRDYTQQTEDIVAGKCGIEFSNMWSPWDDLLQSVIKDPKADWRAFPIPSIDGTPAKLGVPSLNIDKIFVVKKGYTHPEAAVKMMNLSYKYFFDPVNSIGQNAITYGGDAATGTSPWAFAQCGLQPLRKNFNVYVNVSEAVKANDPSTLTTQEQKDCYNAVLNAQKGDRSQWWGIGCYAPDVSSLAVADYYLKNDLYQLDAFYGTPTSTILEKRPTIQKMEVETITQIIMGEADIEAWDSFLEKTKTLGADDMEKEVNEWFTSINK